MDRKRRGRSFQKLWLPEKITMGVVFLFAAAALVGSLVAPLVPHQYLDAVDQIGLGLGGVLGLVLSWRFLRMRVTVQPNVIVAHNALRSRRVEVGSVGKIKLRPRSVGESNEHWTPYVELLNGKGFWLRGIDCGYAGRPRHPIPRRSSRRFVVLPVWPPPVSTAQRTNRHSGRWP